MRLTDAADAVETTIALAVRGGVSQVRIELSPDSLGDIQIHLQHTEDGLVARVVTAHPEAAETLARSSEDLRRSLEHGGTALLRLDISTSGRDGGRGSREPADETADTTAGAAPDGTEETDPSTLNPTGPAAANGGAALVNVLA